MKHPESTWKLVVAGAFVGVLAGCTGTTTDAVRPGPSSSATAPASPTAAASPTPTVDRLAAQDLPEIPAPQDLAPFSGPASDKYGADSVMAAYVFATRWTLQAAFNPSLLALDKPRALDFSAPEEAMTRECAARYRALTAKVESGTATEQEYENVFALSSWGLAGVGPVGSKIAEPAYRDIGFGGGGTAVHTAEGRDALVLRFPIKGKVLLDGPGGEPLSVELAKDMTLTMVQSGDPAQPWLVADWLADRVLSEAVADPAR